MKMSVISEMKLLAKIMAFIKRLIQKRREAVLVKLSSTVTVTMFAHRMHLKRRLK
jgi:hypothetical protein